jgi:hypothetical protein
MITQKHEYYIYYSTQEPQKQKAGRIGGAGGRTIAVSPRGSSSLPQKKPPE